MCDKNLNVLTFCYIQIAQYYKCYFLYFIWLLLAPAFTLLYLIQLFEGHFIKIHFDVRIFVHFCLTFCSRYDTQQRWNHSLRRLLLLQTDPASSWLCWSTCWPVPSAWALGWRWTVCGWNSRSSSTLCRRAGSSPPTWQSSSSWPTSDHCSSPSCTNCARVV